MFVVTPEGVIATEPIGYASKEAPAQYLAEIRKVTPAPVKYVIYSHHHYDHVAGGKPFKDAGAIFVAHRNAHRRLAALQSPDVVMPDMIVEDSGSTILLGGTRIDLLWLGNNHSDNTLVMLLPRERIIFTVDWLPIQGVMFRDVADGYIPEWFAGLDRVLAMDWDRMIPGHPGPAAVWAPRTTCARSRNTWSTCRTRPSSSRPSASASTTRRCEPIELPKYESWSGYGPYLLGNLERFCEYWGRGI
jgi:glyoxylase-like metal-dependent hydrolase (beta-lactamase superfamily II)